MGCQPVKSVREDDGPWGSHSLVLGRTGSVDLSNRKIEMLYSKHMNLLPSSQHKAVRQLLLSNNNLYALTKDITIYPNVENIRLNGNRFDRLPQTLTLLPKLQAMDVSNNPLSAPGALNVLPKIEKLNTLEIRECNMTAIPRPILMCVGLEVLDLSYNEQVNFALADFAKLPRLRQLNMAHCNLQGSTLPGGVRNIVALEELDISHNNYTFDSEEFFGDNISATLKTLHVRQCRLSGVPPPVASLRHLVAIDLSLNPIETVDVLAGRLMLRKMATDKTPSASTAQMPDEEATSVSSKQSGTPQISPSSRAGAIGYASHRMMIKRLYMRNCGLTCIPKYFHKLTSLEELDISDNEQLDDPDLTLFSFPNLRTLNVTNCPFAMTPGRARNEWFDIAKLSKLKEIQYETWKGETNLNPYRTKIPFEICGLQLRYINEAKLKENMFTGDLIDTVINLMADGYYKVDVAMDDVAAYDYFTAVKVLQPLEAFFFPGNASGQQPARAASADSKKEAGAKPDIPTSPKLSPSEEKWTKLRLKIVRSRYVFFLALQAANFDAYIIPPRDVAAMHFSQMTLNPTSYRQDCETVCGRLLDCNYRTFFVGPEPVNEGVAAKQHWAEKKKVIDDLTVASRKVWNLMVETLHDIQWLRYDFWDKLKQWSLKKSFGNGSFALFPTSALNATFGQRSLSDLIKNESMSPPALESLRKNLTEFASPKAGGGAGNTSPILSATANFESIMAAESSSMEMQKLKRYHAPEDLHRILDATITSYFESKGTEQYAQTLRDFFMIGAVTLKHEDEIYSQKIDWSRYVKFIALNAYRNRQQVQLLDNSTFAGESEGVPTRKASAMTKGTTEFAPIEKRTQSLLGPRYNLANLSFADSRVYLPTAAPLSQAGLEGLTPSPKAPSKGKANDDESTVGRSRKGRKRADSTKVQMRSNPVPTIGIAFLLHAHRVSHLKYYKMLILFGLDTVDVEWSATSKNLSHTCDAWKKLFQETYVDMSSFVPLPDYEENGEATDSDKEELAVLQPQEGRSISEYQGNAPMRAISVLSKKSNRGKKGRGDKKVTICGGDSQYGVF